MVQYLSFSPLLNTPSFDHSVLFFILQLFYVEVADKAYRQNPQPVNCSYKTIEASTFSTIYSSHCPKLPFQGAWRN